MVVTKWNRTGNGRMTSAEMEPGPNDPTQKLADEISQILREGAKPRSIANLPVPTLLSLPCVTGAAVSDEPYDRAVALVEQLRIAIECIGPGSRMGEAALVLLGLDFNTGDLVLQDRRDRAAEIMGSRGGWDSFRRGREKTILREIAEKLYGLDHSKTDRPKTEQPAAADGSEPELELALAPLFHLADLRSLKGQRRFLAATKLRILMLILGAGAGGVALLSGWPYVIPLVVAALAFVVALGADFFIAQNRPDRIWFQGRAAAESAKSLAWRYSVGGDPFGLRAGGSPDPDRMLVTRLNEILQHLGGLGLSVMEGEARQITQAMQDLRGETLENRKLAYGIQRIDDQRSWYTRRADWHDRRARRLTMVMLATEILGAMIAVIALAAPDLRGLVALLGGLGAAGVAAAAWSQTRRHQEMTTSYLLAANELASIRELIPWEESEQAWAAFVGDAEGVISREHSLWRVFRGGRVTSPLQVDE